MVTFGSIRYPMPLNKFGEMLRRHGFEMRKSNGRKGYLAVEKTIEDEKNLVQHFFTEEPQQQPSLCETATPSIDEPLIF